MKTKTHFPEFLGVLSHADEDAPREVFKGLTSCGGFHCDLAREMEEALREITQVEGQMVEQLNDIKGQLVRVHARLDEYCIDKFDEVVYEINAKMGLDGGDGEDGD